MEHYTRIDQLMTSGEHTLEIDADDLPVKVLNQFRSEKSGALHSVIQIDFSYSFEAFSDCSTGCTREAKRTRIFIDSYELKFSVYDAHLGGHTLIQLKDTVQDETYPEFFNQRERSALMTYAFEECYNYVKDVRTS